MKVIHKLALSQTKKQTIEIPVGAEIIHFGVQGKSACIWYECTPDCISFTDEYILYAFLTGEYISLPPHSRFLGTALFDNGTFVLHYYIKKVQNE